MLYRQKTRFYLENLHMNLSLLQFFVQKSSFATDKNKNTDAGATFTATSRKGKGEYRNTPATPKKRNQDILIHE